ncbi:MAG: hypothetical protein ACRC02_02285 [Vogesella sp.]|uniref:Y-family DNA polymerase n=1 Tax=Vogesella sp. TaxID=1904252 RepID=UPI003F34B381
MCPVISRSRLSLFCPFSDRFDSPTFITLDGIPDMREHATRLRADVLQRVGIPTCVGIGPSKTLAKLANHVGKVYPRAQGVFAWHWLTPDGKTS